MTCRAQSSMSLRDAYLVRAKNPDATLCDDWRTIVCVSRRQSSVVVVEGLVERIGQSFGLLRRQVVRRERLVGVVDEREHARLLDGEAGVVLRDPLVELVGQALLARLGAAR